MQNKDALNDAGALMLGAAFTDLVDSSIELDIQAAANLLIGTDLWPAAEWPLTNDAEKYLQPTTLSFPHMYVINLATMEVVSATSGVFVENGYNGIEELIETIQSF